MSGHKQANSTAHNATNNNYANTKSPSRRSPQPFHTPNTTQDEQTVYVLTLSLTSSISVPLGQMREEYFPKKLNRTPAHVTLFHALPHSQIDTIDADLDYISSNTTAYPVATGRPFRMRRGVAVNLGSGVQQSKTVREDLRARWVDWLSEQDGGGWRPHWTVMNKVQEEEKVEQAFDALNRVLYDSPHHGKAVGLELWRYDAGNWEWMKEYQFKGHRGAPVRTSGVGRGGGGYDARPSAQGSTEWPALGS